MNRKKKAGTGGRAGELSCRVWIGDIRPSLDGGRFPAKRTVGDTVTVTADLVVDGHDTLTGVVRYRAGSAASWEETPLRPGVNDAWHGSFTVDRTGPWEFTVEAWVDRFGSWRAGLEKKAAADRVTAVDLMDGAALLDAAAARAGSADARLLKRGADALRGEAPPERRVAAALGEELAEAARRHPDRSRSSALEPARRLTVNRELARSGAWYELFPRSASPDPERSGTLRDIERLLPDIAGLGFDVLYFPPIHPIGRTNRKGPNNRLEAGPDSPGSPWAIGAEEGGHTAVHPDLGTIEDFDCLVATAGEAGLEVAMDIALQCSPDHPWVRQHPGWFRHRSDGTIACAENPPKTYEDIYPLDFECADWRALWGEMLGVFRFWIEHGIRIFRVDNPHTKPIRFWQWLIGGLKTEHPDTIFLSEAFTRPKMMQALAKVGFDQSYTYFTWRNTKRELTDYVTELTRPPVSEFLRPNFFTSTPDILPQYLQFGGRPAFQARLVLAATLSASYGIYSGFEFCEAEAVPGTEEYLNSEKYELRRRDPDSPGNLRPLIARINAIRRENPALATNERLLFHPVDADQLICYSKMTADLSNIVLVVVNLDPHHVHHGWVDLPLKAFGIRPGDAFQVHDLIGGGHYLWHGARNYVRLDPAQMPAQLFRLRRMVRTERDFDYFI